MDLQSPCNALRMQLMFQVIHARKIKTEVGLKNVAAHNSRENIYDRNGRLYSDIEAPCWLNTELTQEDFERLGQITNLPEQYSRNVLKKRETLCKSLKRKPQKNASAGIEFVVSASSDFKGDWNSYFAEAEKFLRKKFGDNCIQFATHYDESTPHMHVLFVPILEAKNKKGETVRKYSSSEFLGGRDGLSQLQTDFFNYVGKNFGLERGEAGSRAAHGNAKDFQKKINELENRELAVKEKEQQQIFLQEKLKKTQEEQKAKKMELDEREKTLSDERERLSERSKELGQEKTRLDSEKTLLDDSLKYARDNSLDVFSELEEIYNDESPLMKSNPNGRVVVRKPFLEKVKKSLTGAWQKVKELSESLQRWRNMSPKQLRQTADAIERAGVGNWSEYERIRPSKKKISHREGFSMSD